MPNIKVVKSIYTMKTIQTNAIKRPIALVTGGWKGIGAGIALQLAKKGFDIIVTSQYKEELASETVKNLVKSIEQHKVRVKGIASDLKDLKAQIKLLDDIFTWCSSIDCLVNNAGIGAPVRGDLLEITPDAFDLVLETNLRGTFFLTQKVAQSMLDRSSPFSRSIITISSVSSTIASINRGSYCISKSGLSMHTKLFSRRLAEDNIGVFEIRPGIIKTDMTKQVTETYTTKINEGLVPMKRWGVVEDVANMVGLLATGEVNFSTGSVINVDGGLSIPHL